MLIHWWSVFQCAFALFIVLCLFPLPCHAILQKKEVAMVSQATGAHERQEREEEEEAAEDIPRLEISEANDGTRLLQAPGAW